VPIRTGIYNFVIFESEELARQGEQDPRRQERLQAARALMGEIFDGPPTFIDFTVIEDTLY
jgi:hypothetical protein